MNFSYSLLGLAMTAGLLLAQSGCGQPTAADTTAGAKGSGETTLERVTVGTPVRKTLTLSTSQPGRIESFEETPLFSKVTGYVDEVLVDIGDMVEKDQVLIKLWAPEMRNELAQKNALLTQAEAEVKQAEAAVDSAQAAVDSAKARVSLAEAGIGRAEADFQRWQAEHARIKDLAGRGAVTQKLVEETLNQSRSSAAARKEAAAHVQSALADLSEAQANVRKAEADQGAAEAKLQVAQADVDRSQTMLDYLEIKAPFHGVVTRRGVDTRHYVHPAGGGMTKPLLVVARTDKVRIFVDVPEMESSWVNAGDQPDPATVRVQSLSGGTAGEREGHVTRTSWSLDASNRSLRTQIDLPNADGLLRPGTFATVTIQLEQRENVLTLPVSALVREGRDVYICRVQDGKIDRQPVELGLRSGQEVEILSGLDANHEVVMARADSLQQGQAVEIITPKK